ncbi:C2 family cysteine protease [Nostoc sp. UHCC 0302]|uniref:C2 family cysteine protease n=1 Tax=Nostoc sp. UHCC 0302 TaxID=3134896 RepID=UPI00311CDFD1
MFDTSATLIDSSLPTLGNTSNSLTNNSVNLVQTDLTGLNSQRLSMLANEMLLDASQNQTNATQVLVYTPISVFNTNFVVNAQPAYQEAVDVNRVGSDILGGSYGVLPDVNFLSNSVPTLQPDYAGNSTSTARDIGTLNTSRSFSDWVGAADTNDYYRFYVGGQSNFSLSLTGLSADADVQLLDSFGNVITSSTSGGTSNESITRQLSAGTYYARVYPYGGINTNYNLSLNATTVSDWFGQNLRDSGISGLTRSLAADGTLSRNDMISIFRDAKDGSVIDSYELTDLRTIVSNYSRFSMADSVRVLSNKIANSDIANTNSGIGNLYAGSNSTQMENLISKWFLGNDRPDASYGYQFISGSLFQNGISINDVRQGQVGDCYVLATLCSLATDKSSYIQNMFIDNGDNTFTVRFYKNGVADYVTVDRYLPTRNGYAVYAGWGSGSSSSSSNELWVALAEKAYAQMNESAWLQRGYGRDGINSYEAIAGGNEYKVMSQITALNSTMTTNVTQQDMINRVNSNNLVTFGINARIFGSQYSGGHALAVTSYNSSTGRFHLHNPWGSNHLDLTWQELINWATTGWSYTTV